MVEAMRPVYNIVYVYICILRFYEYIIIGLEGAEGLYEGITRLKFTCRMTWFTLKSC